MSTEENRNNRIIKAILEKEKTLCPGAAALIGISGSFQTGDIHPLSDLDLLILISFEICGCRKQASSRRLSQFVQ